MDEALKMSLEFLEEMERRSPINQPDSPWYGEEMGSNSYPFDF